MADYSRSVQSRRSGNYPDQNRQQRGEFPRFSNGQVLEMSDYDLNGNISDFQAYIRRERKAGRDTYEAECECAYLINERDLRNR